MGADNKQNLIIRVDADTKIGSGHLMRSLALAQSWKAAGGNVIFLTNCESAILIGRLKSEGFNVVEVESSYPNICDRETTLDVLKNYPNSWCVVDGYHFDAEFHGAIRRNGNRVLVIDDTAHLERYDVDAILNQNINADRLKYDCPSETRLLLGTQYALLRKEFLPWHKWSREIPDLAQNILITMGGSDFHNQTLKVILAVRYLKIEKLRVKVVLGASNPHFAELRKTIEESGPEFELIYSADNMAEIMSWSDICISAAGSTCWEAAFMSLPSVLIVTAENQWEIADGLHELGFSLNLGWFEKVSKDRLANEINAILPDKSRRKKMSIIGREIVDGSGGMRVARFLLDSEINDGS